MLFKITLFLLLGYASASVRFRRDELLRDNEAVGSYADSLFDQTKSINNIPTTDQRDINGYVNRYPLDHIRSHNYNEDVMNRGTVYDTNAAEERHDIRISESNQVRDTELSRGRDDVVSRNEHGTGLGYGLGFSQNLGDFAGIHAHKAEGVGVDDQGRAGAGFDAGFGAHIGRLGFDINKKGGIGFDTSERKNQDDTRGY